jgi:ankyrin repeat protein
MLKKKDLLKGMKTHRYGINPMKGPKMTFPSHVLRGYQKIKEPEVEFESFSTPDSQAEVIQTGSVLSTDSDIYAFYNLDNSSKEELTFENVSTKLQKVNDDLRVLGFNSETPTSVIDSQLSESPLSYFTANSGSKGSIRSEESEKDPHLQVTQDIFTGSAIFDSSTKTIKTEFSITPELSNEISTLNSIPSERIIRMSEDLKEGIPEETVDEIFTQSIIENISKPRITIETPNSESFIVEILDKSVTPSPISPKNQRKVKELFELAALTPESKSIDIAEEDKQYIDAQRSDGMTALALAAYHGNMPVLNNMLATEKGVNALKIPDQDGYIPLHWAAARGKIEAVEAIIAKVNEKKIDGVLNAVTNYGETAATLAWKEAMNQKSIISKGLEDASKKEKIQQQIEEQKKILKIVFDATVPKSNSNPVPNTDEEEKTPESLSTSTSNNLLTPSIPSTFASHESSDPGTIISLNVTPLHLSVSLEAMSSLTTTSNSERQDSIGEPASNKDIISTTPQLVDDFPITMDLIKSNPSLISFADIYGVTPLHIISEKLFSNFEVNSRMLKYMVAEYIDIITQSKTAQSEGDSDKSLKLDRDSHGNSILDNIVLSFFSSLTESKSQTLSTESSKSPPGVVLPTLLPLDPLFINEKLKQLHDALKSVLTKTYTYENDEKVTITMRTPITHILNTPSPYGPLGEEFKTLFSELMKKPESSSKETSVDTTDDTVEDTTDGVSIDSTLDETGKKIYQNILNLLSESDEMSNEIEPPVVPVISAEQQDIVTDKIEYNYLFLNGNFDKGTNDGELDYGISVEKVEVIDSVIIGDAVYLLELLKPKTEGVKKYYILNFDTNYNDMQDESYVKSYIDLFKKIKKDGVDYSKYKFSLLIGVDKSKEFDENSKLFYMVLYTTEDSGFVKEVEVEPLTVSSTSEKSIKLNDETILSLVEGLFSGKLSSSGVESRVDVPQGSLKTGGHSIEELQQQVSKIITTNGMSNVKEESILKTIENYEEINAVGDGSCLIHSILLALSDDYRNLSRLNKGIVGRWFRQNNLKTIYENEKYFGEPDKKGNQGNLINTNEIQARLFSNRFLENEDIKLISKIYNINIVVYANYQTTFKIKDTNNEYKVNYIEVFTPTENLVEKFTDNDNGLKTIIIKNNGLYHFNTIRRKAGELYIFENLTAIKDFFTSIDSTTKNNPVDKIKDATKKIGDKITYEKEKYLITDIIVNGDEIVYGIYNEKDYDDYLKNLIKVEQDGGIEGLEKMFQKNIIYIDAKEVEEVEE